MLRMVTAVMLAIVMTGHAIADDRPTFAVDLIAKDRGADAITAAMMTALRAAGLTKTARYRGKPSYKELVQARIAVDCSAAETSCVAAVGAKLGVDYVLTGTIESRGARYVLELNVINVKTHKRVRSLRDVSSRTKPARRWARQVYARIVDDAIGELMVACNASRGLVLIDGQRVTELYQGRATVGGLALGSHTLEVRAAGYKPFADEVVIDGVTNVSVLLDRN
ncbi:MAG: hypothetical protein AB7P03_26795 [Kofleriaceae bacterium]